MMTFLTFWLLRVCFSETILGEARFSVVVVVVVVCCFVFVFDET